MQRRSKMIYLLSDLDKSQLMTHQHMPLYMQSFGPRVRGPMLHHAPGQDTNLMPNPRNWEVCSNSR